MDEEFTLLLLSHLVGSRVSTMEARVGVPNEYQVINKEHRKLKLTAYWCCLWCGQAHFLFVSDQVIKQKP